MEKNTVNLKMFLSRQSKHYHPGDVVSGECVLRLSDHVKLRCISIEFQGESWTYWEETALYTLSHKNAEIYFHKKTTLFGSPDKKKNQTVCLPAGRHAFQFSFKIPPFSLPSSFESKYGYVRYWLKARIQRPWKLDEVTKEMLNVLSVVDVNCPRLLLPSFGEAQKSLNYLYDGTASQLKLTAVTDRNAYCPKERIILTTDIKNLPLTETYQSTVFLVQTISFKSRCGKSRIERCQRKIAERPSLAWVMDELEVPDVPPTMKSCGILTISYHIKVVLSLCNSTESSLDVELPIIIGTVPLRRSYGMINQMIPAARLSRSYSGEKKTFVTFKQASLDAGIHTATAITA
ncbi:arrestin domain-containing protein 2-like [Acropora millepora]|uniref:arrestin domain-containing protein 2-like n=1 Tax=Acropora millepora TaxID=45264 RepID=UPI001CF42BA0|nr:arrestin domain-containing protein 2-like [Acropora millepora]